MAAKNIDKLNQTSFNPKFYKYTNQTPNHLLLNPLYLDSYLIRFMPRPEPLPFTFIYCSVNRLILYKFAFDQVHAPPRAPAFHFHLSRR